MTKLKSFQSLTLLLLISFLINNHCSGKNKLTIIKTEPPGVDVYDQNRIKLGITPYTVTKIKEREVVYSLEKEGYETKYMGLRKTGTGEISFYGVMLVCDKCKPNMKSEEIIGLTQQDGVIWMQKKSKEFDKRVAVELDKVDLEISPSMAIGRLDGERKSIDSKGIHQQIGYVDSYDETIFYSIKESFFDPWFTSAVTNKVEDFRKPKIRMKVSIKNIFFKLGGRSLPELSGPCTISTEWKIYNLKDKEKPAIVIPIEITCIRTREMTDYIIPLLLEEAAHKFLENDTLYRFMDNLANGTVTVNKGEIIKIKIPALKTTANPAVKDKFKNALQAVVTIEGENSFGSGVIISNDGYIITNYHVIDEEGQVVVQLKEEMKMYATIIKSNPEYDLALIKISAVDLKALRLSDSDEAEVGEEVYAIGTPADTRLGQTLTKGIISGKREIKNIHYIQTDVSINPGNSGGPLINDKGEIVGITTMKIFGKGYEGLGFCIPSNVIIEMLNLKFE
ncbi:MAG TPA: trypsin-like peptidase domain-containing protein [Bacteroidia bacterium]|nr:trypsin-like peptidase domain-containing protein [Bacteroidia bacterium]